MGVFNPQALGGSLLPLSICARIIIAVTFQEVDSPPHAKARAEGDYQGLEGIDSAGEECHNSCNRTNVRFTQNAQVSLFYSQIQQNLGVSNLASSHPK